MNKKQITIYKLTFNDDKSIYYFKGINELRDFAIDRLWQGWETDVTEDDLKDSDKVIDFIANDYGEQLDILMVITEDDFNNL